MRVSIKEFKNTNGHKELVLRKKKTLFKHQGLNKNQVRSLTPIIEGGASCSCDTINSTQDRYLLMGSKRGDQLLVSFGMAWNRKDKEFKKGITAIRKADTCEGIIRELSANGIENKPPTSGKAEKTNKKTESKNNKNEKKNKADDTDKKTNGKKGKKGTKGQKGKGKKNKNKKVKSSSNTTSTRDTASKSELEDRALNNFMKAAN